MKITAAFKHLLGPWKIPFTSIEFTFDDDGTAEVEEVAAKWMVNEGYAYYAKEAGSEKGPATEATETEATEETAEATPAPNKKTKTFKN